jgi:hypothetical protein
MTSVPEIYEFTLASSGKLKLRATARLAEGGAENVFEACVLFHEAARIERRVIDVLPFCPAATRLAASVEECFCLVEGRDPPGAGEVWGRILVEKDDVDPATAKAMLARLGPRYEESWRAFAQAVAGCTTLTKTRATGGVVPTTSAEQARALRELRQVLARFPGTPSFWWATYRIAEAVGDTQQAWDALYRTQQLNPHNIRFKAMSVYLSARALPADEADAHIARVRRSLAPESAEVCLMVAWAEIALAKQGRAKERWRRARETAVLGLTQARSVGIRQSLLATRFILDGLLAGKEPTVDVLYKAGLGDVAATAAPGTNVIDLVARLSSARVRTQPNELAA